jgi:hypothetical protein
MVAASKDCCKIGNKAFYGKQKFIHCCGPCALRLHLLCLKMSETEYSFFISQGESTFKCVSCVKALYCLRNENTPIHSMRSPSTSELPKFLSPERELILPNLKDLELLSVQIETVWLNGVNMNNLMETLL